MNLRKQWMRKAAALFAAFLLLAVSFVMPASADIFSGLEAAEDALQSGAYRIVDSVLVPIGLTAAIIVLIVLIILVAVKHSKGDDPGKLGWGIGVTIAVIIVLLAFPVWGPAMFGTSGGSPV